MVAVLEYLSNNKGTIADFMCCTALTYGSAWYFNKSMRAVAAVQVAYGVAYYLHNQYLAPFLKSYISKNDLDELAEECKSIGFLVGMAGGKPENVRKSLEGAFFRVAASIIVPQKASFSMDSFTIVKIGYLSLASLMSSTLINALTEVEFAKHANFSRFNPTFTASISSCAMQSLNFASTYYAATSSVSIIYNHITSPTKEHPIELKSLRQCAYDITGMILIRIIANSDYYLLGTSYNSTFLNFAKLFIAGGISSIILGIACMPFAKKPNGEDTKQQAAQLG